MKGAPELLLHVEDGEGPALAALSMAPAAGGEGPRLDDLRAEARRAGIRAAAAGAPFVGGAARVVGDPEREKSPKLLSRIAREVEGLGGRLLLVQGAGMDLDDMVAIRRETRHVLGLPASLGGSGDPSPFTALGAFASIRACVGELRGKRVAVLGVGRVGSRLVGLLADAGAGVVLADLDAGAAERVAGEHGAEVVPPGRLAGVECDVLSPNGRGPALDAAGVARLGCRFVAGAANGQLDDEEVERLLGERGIGFVPEVVAGSGWLLNLAAELRPGGYDEDRARELTLGLERRAGRLLEIVRAEGVLPSEAVRRLAEAEEPPAC